MEQELYIATYPQTAKYAEAFTPDDVKYDDNVAETRAKYWCRIFQTIFGRHLELTLH